MAPFVCAGETKLEPVLHEVGRAFEFEFVTNSGTEAIEIEILTNELSSNCIRNRNLLTPNFQGEIEFEFRIDVSPGEYLFGLSIGCVGFAETEPYETCLRHTFVFLNK